MPSWRCVYGGRFIEAKWQYEERANCDSSVQFLCDNVPWPACDWREMGLARRNSSAADYHRARRLGTAYRRHSVTRYYIAGRRPAVNQFLIRVESSRAATTVGETLPRPAARLEKQTRPARAAGGRGCRFA